MMEPLSLVELTDDILLELFSYLDTRQLLLARGVCRRWRDLALHPAAWRERELRVQEIADLRVQIAVLSLAPCLSSLAFCGDSLQRMDESLPESDAWGDLGGLSWRTRCAAREVRLELSGHSVRAGNILCNQAELPASRLRHVIIVFSAHDEGFTYPRRAVFIALRSRVRVEQLTVRGAHLVAHLWEANTFSAAPEALPDESSAEKTSFDAFAAAADISKKSDSATSPSGAYLKKLEYSAVLSWPEPLLEFLLVTHAATLTVVRFPDARLPLDFPIALLARCGNLRELHFCPVLEMPLLLQCPSLDTLVLDSLCLPELHEELPRLRKAMDHYFTNATQLKHLSFETMSSCEDEEALRLVLALSSSGRSALESLSFQSASWKAGCPWTCLGNALSGLPGLEALRFRFIPGNPPPVEFLRALTPLTAPRLRLLQIHAPLACPQVMIPFDDGDLPTSCYVAELRETLRRNPGLHVTSLWLASSCAQGCPDHSHEICGVVSEESSRWLAEGPSSDCSSDDSDCSSADWTQSDHSCDCWWASGAQGLCDVPLHTDFNVYSHAEGQPCDLHVGPHMWVWLDVCQQTDSELEME